MAAMYDFDNYGVYIESRLHLLVEYLRHSITWELPLTIHIQYDAMWHLLHFHGLSVVESQFINFRLATAYRKPLEAWLIAARGDIVAICAEKNDSRGITADCLERGVWANTLWRQGETYCEVYRDDK